MKVFSVIIPHKNIPQLLERCISSIPQSDDIEVIVVDDNSAPELVDFNKFPGLDRDNVRVIFDKKEKGAGAARNIGLSNSTGQWLIFADSDDFFHDNAFPLFRSLIQSDKELYVFDTDSVMSDTFEKVDNREDIVTLYKKSYDEKILRYMHHTVWGKIFKRDVFMKNNIKFQEIAASNDAFFAASYGVYAKDVEFADVVCYCCTVRGGSICTKLSYKNINARIKAVFDINDLYQSQDVNVKYWMNLLGPLFNMYKIDKHAFLKILCLYIKRTPLTRIYIDIKESGSRFLNRMLGNVNDKDIKKLQIKE